MVKWSKNTNMIVKKGYQRMLILHKLYEFNVPDADLSTIYVLYIRSILEQNCQIWHHAITKEEIHDLERVQKVALKVILQDRYSDYKQALDLLNLDNLVIRREKLCLKFAKKCLNHENTKDMFPLNKNPDYKIRQKAKYLVQFASTSRLKDSAIPQMQRALNIEANKHPRKK